MVLIHALGLHIRGDKGLRYGNYTLPVSAAVLCNGALPRRTKGAKRKDTKVLRVELK